MKFHRKLLQSAGVRNLDTDPTVLARMDKVTDDPKVRERLHEWLAGRFEEHRRLVIKDPRMVWFRDVWVDVAGDFDVVPRFVVMLRHPSEVSSSRSKYFNAREVTGVAGWINVALMTEQLTAGSPRALVRYPNLTSDWRTELTRMRDQLGLHLDPAPEQSPHPVDDFIDPSLRRMRPGWENVSVPGYLTDLGDRTFDALGEIADHGESSEASGKLAELRAEYSQVHEDGLAMVNASVERIREQTQRRAAKRARKQVRKKVQSGGGPSPTAESSDSQAPVGGANESNPKG